MKIEIRRRIRPQTRTSFRGMEARRRLVQSTNGLFREHLNSIAFVVRTKARQAATARVPHPEKEALAPGPSAVAI